MLGLGPLALIAALAASPEAASAPKPYVGGFCGPVALREGDPAFLSGHLKEWSAKAAPSSQAYAAKPVDSDVTGQLFRFPDPDAPAAFVEQRRGTCALIYPGAAANPAVLGELVDEKLPVGRDGAPAPWRKVVTARVGAPPPPRWFMRVGEGAVAESGGFGLCTTVFEDLRLKDGSPATMVRVSACRLGPDEKLDHG